MCLCFRCCTAWWTVWRGHPPPLQEVNWSCGVRTSGSSRSSFHRRETVWMSMPHWSGYHDQVCMCICVLCKRVISCTQTVFWQCVSSPLSEKYSELYCLSFNPNVNKEEREESWNFIDLVADYKRMGVPNNLWVTTAANSEYRVSLIMTCVNCNLCMIIKVF